MWQAEQKLEKAYLLNNKKGGREWRQLSALEIRKMS